MKPTLWKPLSSSLRMHWSISSFSRWRLGNIPRGTMQFSSETFQEKSKEYSKMKMPAFLGMIGKKQILCLYQKTEEHVGGIGILGALAQSTYTFVISPLQC